MANFPIVAKRNSRLWIPIGSLLLGLGIVAVAAAQTARHTLPPGTQLVKADAAALARSAFRKDQPIVGTYYFYWYDDRTKEHFVDHDGTDALTDHPIEPTGYSYRSVDWHRRELTEMHAAGLDFAMPVYWGYPGDYESWSFIGLKALVEACSQAKRAGQGFPRIGLFYDTSTLQFNRQGYHADLSSDAGKEWLYATVRDFFVHVPAELWATVEGRPIVWLYTAAFAKRQDEAALDYLRAEFARDFGVEPFVVKEVSWQGRADATYAWGAAIKPNLYDVAAVGPGYDHSAVPGRTPLVRQREDGAFYCRSWEWMLSRDPARRPAVAVVETWNEWHEGTDIAPSKEYGRKYVELTRHYADLWHARKRVSRQGKFAGATSVSASLGDPPTFAGLSLHAWEDGKTEPTRVAGKTARTTVPTKFTGRYVYFDVDDAFFFQDDETVDIEVEYFDGAKGTLVLEYDSTDANAPHRGAFKSREVAALRGANEWRTARLRLEDAAFSGRGNGGDFRFSASPGDLVLAKCIVRKSSSSRPAKP